MKINRRLLLASGLSLGMGAALGTYAWRRGLRYPALSFEPHSLPDQLETEFGNFFYTDLVHLTANTSKDQARLYTEHFRAYAPEPKLNINGKGKPLSFSVNNVSEAAKLVLKTKASIDLSEQIEGITRIVEVKPTNQQFELHWQLPEGETRRFAIIGDTGANAELGACINRAQELGADYLLHLGDFNYVNGEYVKAIEAFNNAPLPCFVSVGNHDFHDNGLIYHHFRSEIGPMNNAFYVNGVRLVNLDTGADFFPAQSGNRGKLLTSLAQSPQPQIVFTHRPLKDPRPHDDHNIGGVGEVAWLTKAIKKAGGGYFVNGHVHHSAEFEVDGIRQYTAGEGLGHEDLVLQKQIATLLIADISPEAEIDFSWQNLNIPWAAHLSETHAKKLKRDGRLRQLEWYRNLGFINQGNFK